MQLDTVDPEIYTKDIFGRIWDLLVLAHICLLFIENLLLILYSIINQISLSYCLSFLRYLAIKHFHCFLTRFKGHQF